MSMTFKPSSSQNLALKMVSASWERASGLSQDYEQRLGGYYKEARQAATELSKGSGLLGFDMGLPGGGQGDGGKKDEEEEEDIGLFGRVIEPYEGPVTDDIEEVAKADIFEDLEPHVLIPESAEKAELQLFSEMLGSAADDMTKLFADFIQEYFPNECGYLGFAQKWICNALEKGGTGLLPHIEAQIWERERSRQAQEIARTKDDTIRQFAARGFPLPPGAMAAALQTIEHTAVAVAAQASRDVAIKQAEMELENTRFAVQQAISLYGAAMDAAKGYITAMVGLASSSAHLIPSQTDSQSRLISAAGDYYRARISARELMFKMAAYKPDIEMQAQIKEYDGELAFAIERARLEHQVAANEMKDKLERDLNSVNQKVAVATSAAQALSGQLAALLNALHVSAGVSASDGTSRSSSFSYGGDVDQDVPAYFY